jgi:hypothetical protein
MKPRRQSRVRARIAPTGTMLDHVAIPILCPKCGENDPQPLAELIANDTAICRSCRFVIDLTSENWRTRLAEEAEKFKQIKGPIVR